MDEQDKGALTYQESKVFHAEPFICSVYDNTKHRRVTFEVYGLDTQDMLHKQYTYNDFDGLFRFNAELMNPNRKEGRYHWVIERLEIGMVGGDKKLRLKKEVTVEVPEKPIYEETRKIPTGRMDLKERQRLREQMDMLNIKRDENIRKRREASKARFLKYIFEQKEIAVRKAAEQDAAIEKEREERYQWQLQMEAEEEAAAGEQNALANIRRIAAENKDQAHEEKEEEDLRQLRLRWRAADAEKKKAIDEARARKARDVAAAAEAAKKAKEQAAQIQAKRAAAWTSREKRVKSKLDAKVQKALSLIPELKRLANLKVERKNEYLQEINETRWPIFEAQLERSAERLRQREAEAEAVRNYHTERSIPKKEKVKGKKAAKGGPKGAAKKKAAKGEAKEEGKEGGEAKAEEPSGGASKADNERIVDSVESKMRAEMEEQRKRVQLEQKRQVKTKEREEKRIKTELKRIKEYKKKVEDESYKKEALVQERRLILETKNTEKERAEERKQEEQTRLAQVRAKRVEALEQKQLEFLSKA